MKGLPYCSTPTCVRDSQIIRAQWVQKQLSEDPSPASDSYESNFRQQLFLLRTTYALLKDLAVLDQTRKQNKIQKSQRNTVTRKRTYQIKKCTELSLHCLPFEATNFSSVMKTSNRGAHTHTGFPAEAAGCYALGVLIKL